MLHSLIATFAKILVVPTVLFMSLAGYHVPTQGEYIDHSALQASVQPVADAAPTFGSFNPTGGGTYYLQSSISSTQVTINLSSFKEPGSNIPYTMSYLNSSIEYATINPQSTQSEFVSFTGITQNGDGSATLTGVVRGLGRSYPYTASTTLSFAFPGQTRFILSNPPQLTNQYANKSNTETIANVWTFSPVLKPTYSSNPSFGASDGNAFVNYSTLLATAISGAGTSTEGSMGIVQLASPTQATNGTASSTTGAPLVLGARIATSTCQVAQGSVLAASSTTGKLSGGCLDTTSNSYTWSKAQTFSSTISVAATSTLATTTINGVLAQPRFGGTGLDGALSISSGTTTVDLKGQSYVELNYTSVSITATGNLAFSNPNGGGTFVTIRSQGAVTITCTNGTCIDIHGLGGSNAYYLFAATAGNAGSGATAGTGGALPTTIAPAQVSTSTLLRYGGQFWVGANGGAGGCNINGGSCGTAGAGGIGGGGLLMEVAGTLNFTGGIYAVGSIGGNASGGTSGCTAGGGGGSGGFVKVLYNFLTANTGAVTATGGTGGKNSSACINVAGGGGGGGSTPYTVGGTGGSSSVASAVTGGTGATGYSSFELNTNF